MPWYAVQTKSNYESKVHDAFSYQGIPDLYPTYEKRSKWSDRQVKVTRPLFPGYLFVDIFTISVKAAVAAVTGVFQILGGRDPIVVPESEILQVRILMASPHLLSPVLSYHPHQGDKVEVVSGVFSGVTGSVERWKEKQERIQVTVRIPMLNAAATVQVDAECLRRVSTV